MELGLAGAAVCVQGGAQGRGRATAETFAAEGSRVPVLARDKGRLDETVAQLTELGSPDAVGLPADVTDTAGLERAFAVLADRWGQLNSLICAVGPEVSDLAWTEISDERWLRAYDLGAVSAVRCARAALPFCGRRGGRASSTSRRCRHAARDSGSRSTPPPRPR